MAGARGAHRRDRRHSRQCAVCAGPGTPRASVLRGAGPALRLLAPARDAADPRAAGRARPGLRPRAAHRRHCSRASRSTTPSAAPRCTWRCATSSDRPIVADGQGRDAGRAGRAARRCASSSRAVHEARITGATGARMPTRREHRHRRVGSGPRDGHRGPREYCTPECGFTSCPTWTDPAGRRAGSGAAPRHAVHRLFEDLRHLGDRAECQRGPQLAPGPAGRGGRRRGTSSPCR